MSARAVGYSALWAGGGIIATMLAIGTLKLLASTLTSTLGKAK